MKCFKCGSEIKVDPRYEMCAECLKEDIFESLARILKPAYQQTGIIGKR